MNVSSPEIKERSGFSIVWIIPLVTALVGGWLIVKTLSEQGPVITISFKTAEGIEVGKTKVKYKNVDIGIVEDIQFSDDLSNVIITASFNTGTESFFRRNTRFWVVKPQLSLRGATGLSTLISGAYIEIEPGPGAKQFNFVGLEKQPVVTADEVGKKIVLSSDKLRSIDTGTPIYYQGILAGEVLGYELGTDHKSIFVHAFIKDPFDQLVRGNTRFWNVSGIDVSLDADGFNVRTESLQSIIYGGIAFETPDTLEPATENIEDLVFTLHENYEDIKEQTYIRKIKFVLFFDSSVRGLNIGAPVEFKGIKIGSVLDIRLEFDREETSFRIPVLIEVEPERIIERNIQGDIPPGETLAILVERGLRAQLQQGSLLTGQLFVKLDMHPGTPVNLSGEETPYPELPTLASASFATIAQSAEAFLSKLETVEIDKIGSELLRTLEGANTLINSPEMQDSIVNLQASLVAFRSVLTKMDDSNLKEAINSGNEALGKIYEALELFDETLVLTNDVLQPNSPLQYNVIKMTSELEETARSVRSLVETLERHPQALIFGKDVEAEGE